MTVTVDILNPKAKALLKSMADDKLITIQSRRNDDFMRAIQKIRRKAAKQKPISLAEITKEVEIVRSKMYAAKK